MRIKKRPVFLLSAVAAVLAAGAVVLWLVASADSRAMKSALHPDKYRTVCVEAEMKTEYLNRDDGETSREDGDGYYVDGEGNVLQPGDEGYPEPTRAQESFEPIVTMKRADGLVYESGISGETYYFKEDGTPYALFLDTSASKDGSGVWTKVPLARFNLKPLFDPACLAELSAGDFVRENGRYVPVAGRLEAVFHTLFGTSEENRATYCIHDMTLTVENGRLTAVTAVYDLGAEVRLTQRWSFSYDGFRLALPGVQAEYPETS